MAEAEGDDREPFVVRPSMLPAQRAFICEREVRIPMFIGGFGSGKTTAGVQWATSRGVANAPGYGLAVAPTYSMVRDVIYRTFVLWLNAHGIPFKWHRTDHILTVFSGYEQQFDVLLRSGDRPERLVGTNPAWAWIDEPGLQPEETINQVIARVRDPNATLLQIGLTGTPEGVSNHLYRLATESPEGHVKVIRAKTTDNPYLDPRYVESLRARFSPEEVEQYLNGEFVVLEGGVYRHFKRAKHCRPCTNPLDGQLVVGADFNVAAPKGSNLGMCWVVGRIIGDELHVFGEIIHNNTNTYEQADALLAFIRDEYAKKGQRIDAREAATAPLVYCDASGDARRSSAAKSDVAILRQAGFRVVTASKNPPVKDRVNTLDHRFRIDRMLIDPVRCPNLVRALEQQAYDMNGDPEKKGGVDNVNDALGYLTWGQVGWRTTILKGNETPHAHTYGTQRR